MSKWWSMVRRAWAIWRLTGRYFRSAQVPSPCHYNFNGQWVCIAGERSLALVLENSWDDGYGLRRQKKLKTILDVGANIGVFSLHARSLFPDALIHAVEPSPETLVSLHQNTRDHRITVIEGAAGSSSRMASLQVGDDPTATHLTSETQETGVRCHVFAFDNLVRGMGGKVSFLKLDCEGGEYEILETETMKNVQHLACEFHAFAGREAEDGLRLLRAHGFTITQWIPFAQEGWHIAWASNLNFTE
jgi:FkbM family methyltransferase